MLWFIEKKLHPLESFLLPSIHLRKGCDNPAGLTHLAASASGGQVTVTQRPDGGITFSYPSPVLAEPLLISFFMPSFQIQSLSSRRSLHILFLLSSPVQLVEETTPFRFERDELEALLCALAFSVYLRRPA